MYYSKEFCYVIFLSVLVSLSPKGKMLFNSEVILYFLLRKDYEMRAEKQILYPSEILCAPILARGMEKNLKPSRCCGISRLVPLN